tara:strand:- start:482 stop:709 length:228 start_codon:yes stop_codon:yes gene_type:complete
MVSLDDLSIGLVFGFISMLLVFSMILYYIYNEKIKEYCVLASKKINMMVENKSNHSSPSERISLIEEDLEGFELV